MQRNLDLTNRMRESRTSGSVRGALGNWGPYSTVAAGSVLAIEQDGVGVARQAEMAQSTVGKRARQSKAATEVIGWYCRAC